MNWHAQDTTTHKPNVFLTGIHRLSAITADGISPPPTTAEVKAILVNPQKCNTLVR